MKLPDESPRLNPVPFFVGDLLLVLVAVYIWADSSGPLGGTALIAVTACVCVGAILACIPIVLNYTWRRDVELAERQEQIVALAQSLASAVNQLSIAASGLHGIAESSQKTLKQVEQIPAKLQEKVAEFREQLNEITVSENEMLAQEINTLRASETERLDSTLAAIKKAALEIATLEDASRGHTIEVRDALARHVSEVTKVIATHKAALEAGRADADKALRGVQAEAVTTFEKKLTAIMDRLMDQMTERLKKLPKPEERSWQILPPAPQEEEKKAEPIKAYSETIPETKEEELQPPQDEIVAPVKDEEEPLPEVEEESEESEETPVKEIQQEQPKPVREPVAAVPQPRKKTPKPRVVIPEEPMLDLDLPPREGDEYSQSSPDEIAITSAVSADGTTRLIATAYIGIGNNLFIRGNGPGLSWDKGVPLQFMSIGKWRWESADATEPITFKLYKNDSIECAQLGELQMQPGHQCEVSANF